MTQGIQSTDNEIPLVQGRRTLVRASAWSSNGNVSGVQARLRAYRNNVELSGSPRFAENQPITVMYSDSSRVNTNDLFWFFIPEHWRSGAVRFRLELDYNNTIPETDENNNTLEETVIFWPGADLNLVMVPLQLYPGGDTSKPPKTYYATNPSFPALRDNILRFHPIRNIKVWYLPVFLLDPPPNPKTDNGRSQILLLVEFLNFFTNDPAPVTHYMGMVHPDLATGVVLGMGNRPGRHSWTKMVNANDGWPAWHIIGGSTMAHELGHNKGLRHMKCDGDEHKGGEIDTDYPYPYPDCRLAGPRYFGFDVYYNLWGLSGPTVLSNNPNAAPPNRAFPLLGYKRPKWISPYEYCKLLPTYGIVIPCGALAAGASAQEQFEQAVFADPLAYADPAKLAALQAATRYILAGGIIDLTANTAQFNGVYQTDTPGTDTIAAAAEKLGYAAAFGLDADPPYLLVQVNAAGAVLDSQELFLENADGDGSTQHFLELAPLAQGTNRLQVRRGATVLAERIASAAPPTVQLLAPNGGGELRAGDVVRWSAGDADGDALNFTLQYSADNGQTWRLVALAVTGDSFTLPDPLGLPGSTQGRMRVIANDGFWTGQDDSDGVFTVANSAPWAAIRSPKPLAHASVGELVLLEGLATDLEDGPLADDRLSWSSDRDGFLGVGEELAVESLTAGVHQITLTATDRNGQTAQATVTIFVDVNAPRVYLPVVLK